MSFLGRIITTILVTLFVVVPIGLFFNNYIVIIIGAIGAFVGTYIGTYLQHRKDEKLTEFIEKGLLARVHRDWSDNE
jgi:uncharacterized membrane protein YfcA